MQEKTTKYTKILRLIRHSKSSWAHDLQDIKRPLKSRGVNDAKIVSSFLFKRDIRPELILCSPAERTLQTSKIFIDRLQLENIQFELRTELYDFSGESLLETIKNTNNSINDLMIFGHNNALTNIANTYGSKLIENVVTSGYVEISFNVSSWQSINKGITNEIVFPKDLKATM